MLRCATVSIRSFLVNEYDQFDMTGALRTSRDGTMVPCAAMRFALARPRRFEDQPGLPRRLCVVWGFLLEGPLSIERFLQKPYAKAQYDCGCPALCKVRERGKKGSLGLDLQVVIPEGPQRDIVIAGCHEGAEGHASVLKTYQKVRDRFYWPGMFLDVQDFVRSTVAYAIGTLTKGHGRR